MAQNSPLIIKDVRIFTGHEFIQDGFVESNNGSITRVGHGQPTDVPANAQVLSKPKHTLIPGLIDAHMHADDGNLPSLEQSLRFGVTTVCDLGNMHDVVQKLRKLNADPANMKRLATLVYAGQPATCTNGWPDPIGAWSPSLQEQLPKWIRVNSPAEAESFVDSQLSAGASYIKTMHESGFVMGKFGMPPAPQMSQETRRALVAAAHSRGVPIVTHAFEYNDAMAVLEDGIDGLAHLFMNKPTDGDSNFERFVSVAKKNKSHVCPTLSIINSLTTEGASLRESFAHDPRTKQLLLSPDEGIKHACGCMATAPESASPEHAYEAAIAAYKAGIPLLAGTDCASFCAGTAYGMTLIMEMYIFVHKVCMKPAEVLRSATSLTAERMKLKNIGSLQQGYKADMVLVEGDLEALMQDAETKMWPLKGVWHEGVLVEAFEEKQ